MPDPAPPAPPGPDMDDRTVVRPLATPAPSPSSSPATLFAGRYALTRLIGRGGMGSVYQALDTLVGDTVALKQLELGREASADALERFRREVRLARRITHPHVARMHDLGTHEGQAFLTMEYVEGGDLRELIAHRGAIAAPDAARIALAVSEGLAAAHAAGVVHRDLKPANILLEASGRVVLTDFGIARALVEERAARTQGAIGTPLYMAPEQVAGEPVDARADLYAVGLLLYELLTGRQPFSAETPWAIALARLNQAPPDLRQDTTVPAPLARLLSQCLERHPAARPQSAAEVASALREWLRGEGQTTAPQALPPASRPEGVAPLTPRPTLGTVPAASSSVAPRGIAFLPLRHQGPPDTAWLADTLTEALIDQLSRTRGFRVLGSGVMARFRDTRDPRAVGGELGVDWVVDGTLQSAGPSARVSVRLLESRTGAQLWSGRFDGASEGFALQDRLGPRIAEELRFEAVLAAWRDRVPPDVLVLYRQAHQHLHRERRSASDGASPLLSRCLELAPAFLPAVALYALSTVRACFSSREDTGPQLRQLARESVERALRQAPEFAETHLARSMLMAQDGDWRSAVTHVRMSLDIAPFHALSLQYLGSIQCEAGHSAEGLERLRLAHSLAPDMGGALIDLARTSALLGRMEDYRWALGQLAPSQSHRPVVDFLRVRVAGWTGDLAEARRAREEFRLGDEFLTRLAHLYAEVVLGELDASRFTAAARALLSTHDNPRFVSMACQFVAEMACLAGDAPAALGYFQRAANTALIDLDWVEFCPVLGPMRALPGFIEGRALVRRRVEAIWNS
ncbi:protein kinase domain-containing protein [Melittangium boletus]|uniref:protein kinase domain-containing protein n=1 Tax=Melittangium boletus TaxID=83453 RepID=UPI003DA2C1CD